MKTSLAMLLVVAAIVTTNSPFAFAKHVETAGLLAGSTFRPEVVRLVKNASLDSVSAGGRVVDAAQGYLLSFTGADGGNDLTLKFNLDKGLEPFGRVIECKPFASGSSEFQVQREKGGQGSVGRGLTGVFVTCSHPASGLSGNAHAYDRIEATLKFERRANGKVMGTISLRLADELKTQLSGTFSAKLEGF
jgi:hypothetical protein